MEIYSSCLLHPRPLEDIGGQANNVYVRKVRPTFNDVNSIKLGCIAFPNAGYPHFSESSAYIVDPFTTCLYLDLMNILMIAFSHVGVPLLPNWFVMQQSPGWGLPFLEFCLTYFNPVWSVFTYFSSKWCSYLLLCTAINPFSTELLFQWRFKIIVMWYLNIRNVQNAELVIYF